MARCILITLCFSMMVISLGCESESKESNPGKLEYNKDGPPKRQGPPAPGK
jgi:hypothetical protein